MCISSGCVSGVLLDKLSMVEALPEEDILVRLESASNRALRHGHVDRMVDADGR